MLDFTLSPARIELRQKARDFAIKEILPVAWRYDGLDETPMPVLEKALQAGLMNQNIPEEFGGPGLGLVDAAVVTEEFAAASAGICTTVMRRRKYARTAFSPTRRSSGRINPFTSWPVGRQREVPAKNHEFWILF